jgi:hypothetical protein
VGTVHHSLVLVLLLYGVHTTCECSGAAEHGHNGGLCIVSTCSWRVANFGFGRSTCIHDRNHIIKVLVSPNGVKAKMEHYSKNGQACCLVFNSTAGCSDKNCSFSHHCAACGDTKHGIMGHDD